MRLERDLDALFAHTKATPGLVDDKLAEIGAAQARYRGSHLKTHIEATKLLAPDQVARYDALRGYTAVPAGRSGGHGQGHKHWGIGPVRPSVALDLDQPDRRPSWHSELS